MSSPSIVVIGASAGGVEAVTRVVRELPADFAAPVFVAMHFPLDSTSVLPRILSRAGPLPAAHPRDGDPILPSHVYVAPPDRHLIIHRRAIHLARGPRENGYRPAVDPMFRSAAVAYDGRAIGVILTGNLDDGTAGLLAIKRRGGTAIVQDPSEALFPSMPASAIEHVRVDHVLRLDQIASVLVEIVAEAANAPSSNILPAEASDDAQLETAYDELDLRAVENPEDHPGKPSQFGCPDCGGVLWEIHDGDLVRYRCRVGHAWSAEALRERQAVELDAALWMALRTLEESVSLTRRMADRARQRGNDILAAKFERDARATGQRARIIRDAIVVETETRRVPEKSAEGTTG